MLQEGVQAPDFQAQDQNGNTLSLADFKGKTLVLYFYPKDNTPGCTTEACNLRDNHQILLDNGLAVLGVSPDSLASHEKFASQHALPFSLLADTEKSIMKAYGAWGLKKNYGREYEGVIRSTFLIDGDGKIIKVFKRVDTKAHAQQILKALDIKIEA